MMRVAWRTVGEIARRVVDRVQRGDPLDGLKQIGVDELSYRRHHEYITVVIDHLARRVVWARPGKDAATLSEFFKELGPERCKQLEAVTIDMSAAYIKAVTEASPQATIIFDRFHVQRLAHNALDEVRRAEVRENKGTDEAGTLKRMRFVLLKNPWNLTNLEGERVAQLQHTNKPIYRAYMMKEGLAGILDGLDVDVARVKLRDWIGWAARSRLEPFKKLASHGQGALRGHPRLHPAAPQQRAHRGDEREDPNHHAQVLRLPFGQQPDRSDLPLLLWGSPCCPCSSSFRPRWRDVHSLRRRTSRAARDRRRAVLRWPAGGAASSTRPKALGPTLPGERERQEGVRTAQGSTVMLDGRASRRAFTLCTH